MTQADSVALLCAAEVMSLCGVAAGKPVLKTLHGVVVDDWLCFHSSPAGEKTSLIDCPVVVSCEETVARIPSWFLDPERACPATTLYRSVQAHGVLREVTTLPMKARALEALMQKLQPSGGYVPITHDDARYAPAVRGLLVAGLRLDDVDGKAKLAQNRSPTERSRLIAQLWQRGDPGDVRAIELLRSANPGLVLPPVLTAPSGFLLHGWLDDACADDAASLLEHEYWNEGVYDVATLRSAHRGAQAWVGATDEAGRLVASARAISDGAKYAWVYDVIVAPSVRGRGLGRATMRLLLDHPKVRPCRRVLLGTRDAQPLYTQLGFVPTQTLPPRPWPTTEMVLTRHSTNQAS